jgi:mannitol-1-/sugar-/sorbitol-6-/2-deoxyglucose-6-phosphatase
MLMTLSKPPQAIFFDMDGTLVDSESRWKVAERAWITQKGYTLDSELQKKFTGITALDMVKLAKEHLGLPGDANALNQQLSSLVKTYLLDVEEQPGATELITYVIEKNIPKALVSNSAMDIIEATLARQPWQSLLEHRFSIDHVERGKPAPDIYLLAAKNFDVEPAQCWVIEDSVTGVTAAVNAGMICFAVCHEEKYRQALEQLTPRVVSSLFEVLEALKTL